MLSSFLLGHSLILGRGVLPVDKIDPKDKPFTRFYLEYCEEGDLFGLLKEYMQ